MSTQVFNNAADEVTTAQDAATDADISTNDTSDNCALIESDTHNAFSDDEPIISVDGDLLLAALRPFSKINGLPLYIRYSSDEIKFQMRTATFLVSVKLSANAGVSVASCGKFFLSPKSSAILYKAIIPDARYHFSAIDNSSLKIADSANERACTFSNIPTAFEPLDTSSRDDNFAVISQEELKSLLQKTIWATKSNLAHSFCHVVNFKEISGSLLLQATNQHQLATTLAASAQITTGFDCCFNSDLLSKLVLPLLSTGTVKIAYESNDTVTFTIGAIEITAFHCLDKFPRLDIKDYGRSPVLAEFLSGDMYSAAKFCAPLVKTNGGQQFPITLFFLEVAIKNPEAGSASQHINVNIHSAGYCDVQVAVDADALTHICKHSGHQIKMYLSQKACFFVSENFLVMSAYYAGDAKINVTANNSIAAIA